MKSNKKVISLEEKRNKINLERELSEIKLDLEMIERHNNIEITEEIEKNIIEFMNIRKEMGHRFEKWRYENIVKTEEKLALWSYLTEIYQNLLLPSIDDFELEHGDILEKLDQTLAVAAALEGFHMSCMKTYLDMEIGED